jgi:hypothetical protein
MMKLILFRSFRIEKGEMNPVAVFQQKVQGLIVVFSQLKVRHQEKDSHALNSPKIGDRSLTRKTSCSALAGC